MTIKHHLKYKQTKIDLKFIYLCMFCLFVTETINQSNNQFKCDLNIIKVKESDEQIHTKTK